MIESIGRELVAFGTEYRTVCQLAAEASSESKPIMPVNRTEPYFFVGAEWTPRVLKGLARISLESPDYDYDGLTPPKADYILGELSGSIDDFIYSILRNRP